MDKQKLKEMESDEDEYEKHFDDDYESEQDEDPCECKICNGEEEEEKEENEERGFRVVKQPTKKKKPKIFFFEILKISFDDGLLTKSILNCKRLFTKYRNSIYNQFTEIYMTRDYDKAYDFTEHPSQVLGDKREQCLCSQLGLLTYFIVHNRYTNKKCWVGSECINKFFPHLVPRKKELLRQEKNRELGNICIYCDEPLKSMKSKINKEMYCNYRCKTKMQYTIPFGKFKKMRLVEVICTREGQSYIEWINEVKQENPKAFSKYPLFLEIINETVLEEE